MSDMLPVSVRLPYTLLRRIHALMTDTTVADFVRGAVEDYVERKEKEARHGVH